MDPELSAPPVVAVVVARDPGDWLEQCLLALAAQDYPNQSLLVIDRGNSVLPPRRVADVLPEAYLRRPPVRSGFAGAANDVLETVQGAAFLLFCHDDVVLERVAVRLMVEEALRSNAGIVGPKVVEWEHPDRLLEVGLAVDKTGAAGSLEERGELDQEQHDAVRDVFAVSTACMLVRQDLLATLGGFDAVLGDHGAGIDLCWRAQVAGARVVVAPQARARERRETAGLVDSDPSDPEAVAASARARVRTMLKSYSLPHLLRVLPQAALVTAVESLVALLTRRPSEAQGLLRGWWWNLRRPGEVRRLRREVRRARRVPDSDVRRLQARGSVRMNAYLQRRLHAQERARALVEAGENLVESVWKGPSRLAGILFAVLAVAWLAGSRHLLTERLPAVGELMPLPPPGELLAHWWSGWRATGMGAAGPAPPLFGVLALLGGALFGQMDLLQKALVLGAWPLGTLGAWRLSRPLQSPLARVVGVVAYLAVPLPYNALARGSWSGLAAYAAAPWLLGRLARSFRLEPYTSGATEPRRRAASVVGLAVVLALASLVAPAIALTLLVVTLGMVAGSLAVSGKAGTAAALATLGLSLAGATLLLAPWSFELLKPGGWATLTGVAGPGGEGPGFAELLRFEVGPMGAAPLGWAFVIAAALPLFVGHGWRLAWAARLWCGALACVAVAWAGGRDFLPLRLGRRPPQDRFSDKGGGFFSKTSRPQCVYKDSTNFRDAHTQSG
jgi:GT2 family glycosyltransferase